MKILLTGANGYIGLRLLPALLDAGHQVAALVRDAVRFPRTQFESFLEDGSLTLLEGDALKMESLPVLAGEFDASFYLLHSMGAGAGFEEREERCASNFTQWISQHQVKRVIYLGGLVPEGKLSKHLASREKVNDVLRGGIAPVTTLRASIIVGSGSASFEIIRDLAEKLPVMITPKWTKTRCQPIAIRNVIGYLVGSLAVKETEGESYDIGGPEVLSYLKLLKIYASQRGLSRYLIPVPLLTPRLSAYWLRLVTTTTLPLACSLISSLRNETICRENKIRQLIPQKLLSYEEAIGRAFVRIEQSRVPSSWIDSLASGKLQPEFLKSIQVPEHGVLRDQQAVCLTANRDSVVRAVWSVGGKRGWPSMDWAWKLRGAIDRFVGGIGVRRGRRHPHKLYAGDALDFWRVVLADDKSDDVSARLILFAEMKMPGEAWLDFEITQDRLIQTATFRPRGLVGRAYWFAVLPFHLWLFPRMAKRLAEGYSGSGS